MARRTEKEIQEPLESPESQKQTAVNIAVANIEKTYGKGIIASQESDLQLDFLSTGLPRLDKILGGGFAKGRISEVYAQESTGKTSLALRLIAETQKKGELCAFLDLEHALNPQYLKDAGVNMKTLIISQPDFAEQACNIALGLIRSGGIGLLVFDSVASLLPKAEMEGEIGDTTIGLRARIFGQFLRDVIPVLDRTNSHILFLNQLRNKINSWGSGSPWTTTGGNSLKYYASHRLELRRTGNIQKGEDIVGMKINAKCAKNKVSCPFQETEMSLIFGHGISAAADILAAGLDLGLIIKSGSWYSTETEKLGQGETAAITAIENNPSIRESVLEACK